MVFMPLVFRPGPQEELGFADLSGMDPACGQRRIRIPFLKNFVFSIQWARETRDAQHEVLVAGAGFPNPLVNEAYTRRRPSAEVMALLCRWKQDVISCSSSQGSRRQDKERGALPLHSGFAVRAMITIGELGAFL